MINPRSHIRRKHEYRRTFVRHGATIGANATILCGVTLGAWCFIGAGAVVTRNVPPHALMTGVPARVTGWVCECGVKLDDNVTELTCPADGNRYARRGETLTRITEESE